MTHPRSLDWKVQDGWNMSTQEQGAGEVPSVSWRMETCSPPSLDGFDLNIFFGEILKHSQFEIERKG